MGLTWLEHGCFVNRIEQAGSLKGRWYMYPLLSGVVAVVVAAAAIRWVFPANNDSTFHGSMNGTSGQAVQSATALSKALTQAGHSRLKPKKQNHTTSAIIIRICQVVTWIQSEVSSLSQGAFEYQWLFFSSHPRVSTDTVAESVRFLVSAPSLLESGKTDKPEELCGAGRLWLIRPVLSMLLLFTFTSLSVISEDIYTVMGANNWRCLWTLWTIIVI